MSPEEMAKRIEELEAALRQCDAYLDEHACGACRVPPTADVLEVPAAVNRCVSAWIQAAVTGRFARRRESNDE